MAGVMVRYSLTGLTWMMPRSLIWDPSDEVDSALRITAKNVDGTITSARVKSDIDVGPYGYYEVRAKLPSEDGA